MLPLVEIHIMKLFNIYISVILSIVLISCGSKSEKNVNHPTEEGVFEVVVTHAAGDRWSNSDSFLPLPMNVGKVNNKKVLILSDRLNVKSNILVKPLGAISLIENDSLKTYVLAFPHDHKVKSMEADGFDEFSTVHSSAKWIVEQYLINRKGGHSTRVKSWDNEKSAINYLLN